MWLVEFSLTHRIPVACFSCHKPKKEEDEDDQPEGLETGGLEEIPDEEESEDEDFEENEK